MEASYSCSILVRDNQQCISIAADVGGKHETNDCVERHICEEVKVDLSFVPESDRAVLLGRVGQIMINAQA